MEKTALSLRQRKTQRATEREEVPTQIQFPERLERH